MVLANGLHASDLRSSRSEQQAHLPYQCDVIGMRKVRDRLYFRAEAQAARRNAIEDVSGHS